MLDFQDFALLIGLTTVLTTATIIPVQYRFRQHICDEIKDLAIRLGVVERK